MVEMFMSMLIVVPRNGTESKDLTTVLLMSSGV